MSPAALEAAQSFVWLSGRLSDRHRFAHAFAGGDAGQVLAGAAAVPEP